MKEKKVYNVQTMFEEMERIEKESGGYISFKGADYWNNDFIIFEKNNDNQWTMDLYTMHPHLHGYTKRHYNRIPQKYIEYQVNARYF